MVGSEQLRVRVHCVCVCLGVCGYMRGYMSVGVCVSVYVGVGVCVSVYVSIGIGVLV